MPSSTSGRPDPSLIDTLCRPEAFDHPADDVDLIETHISWVILAGDFVYKIKKPIVLDFLDFGTLEKRRHCCEEEIRLNRPWAPDLYIGVVPIAQQDGEIRFGGNGDVLEYAVKMHRFEQHLRLDRQLAAGRLSVADMKELGRNVADRHAAAEIPGKGDRHRLVEQAIHWFWENFDHLGAVLSEPEYSFLHGWTAQEIAEHEATLWRRYDDGFVRDCHGDLHLGNLVRLPTGITTFDCIEFNPDLRFSDVWADVGFLTMDLLEKGRPDLAAHFLNRYLECSGDYEGAALLDLYFVYRCLVRAKVAAILAKGRVSAAEAETDIAEAREYCEMARRQASKGPRLLVIMSGLSGSGKTWLSGQLMATLPAIRVRSDIERKRLFGFAETADSRSGIGTGIYAADADRATYERLFDIASLLLRADHHVILDAAFLKPEQRRVARRVGEQAGCQSVLLSVEAPEALLRARIRERAASDAEVSEANIEVLEHQLAGQAPPKADEAAIRVDTSGDVDIEALVRAIGLH